MSILIKGIILGFSIAAPVGPIGLICIQRTLMKGRVVGLVSGLGAATADMIYGLVAGFGLTVLSGWLISSQLWLRIGGIVFLIYLGIRILLSKPTSYGAEPLPNTNLLNAYASVFGLTLTNPMTIFSFLGIMTGAGVGISGVNQWGVVPFIAGVFVGSALWWTVLSTTVGLFRNRISTGIMVWINRTSGLVILSFAAAFLLELL